jgi:hypothetical protein
MVPSISKKESCPTQDEPGGSVHFQHKMSLKGVSAS